MNNDRTQLHLLGRSSDEDRLRLRISRQSPPEREGMLVAMRKMNLSPVRMQLWIDGDEKLVPEELEALEGWVRGDWGYLSTGDGIQFIRMKKAGPAVNLGVRTHTPTVAKDYGDATIAPKAGMGMTVEREADASRIPASDEESIRRKRAIEAQQAERAKPKKPAIPLLSWGRKA